ncbi:MAG: rhodanese-related sulfurtransferase [Verrucomicrobiales bacterium]|nr:rhodanese-related sulfurtransferase [Verrucomicrobiales bacterium]HQZ29939.1 rhodanese-related sulfurtransferase [Verrucomicrobiales bacterium]
MTSEPSIAISSPFQVLLYYRYAPIPDPVAFCAAHRSLCESLELRGRIIIGVEGINGTVSGTTAHTNQYVETMQNDPLLSGIEFKVDAAEDHVFPKLSVKMRKEIVTLGLPNEADIDPNALTGNRLSPREFYEAMQEDNVVVIDGRNDYEAELGRFKNALCPPIRNFREFPNWLKENTPNLRGKKILTYCTGGIRCEKLSGYIRQEGFDDVHQLDGGIVKYSKDPEVLGRDFDGLCYVFDERVGVEVNHTETRKVITRCRYCGVEEARYGNCRWPDCNEQIFVCPDCRESHGLFCGEECLAHAGT